MGGEYFPIIIIGDVKNIKKRMKSGKGQLIIQGREFRQLKIHLPWN
jgi:hypothetical protein